MFIYFITFLNLLTINSFSKGPFTPYISKSRFIKMNSDDFTLTGNLDLKFLDFLKKKTKNKYCIIDNKKNIQYYNMNTFKKKNKHLLNKKIISISPGGLKGFYLMGVINFIKQHYNLSNYIFTGASAGAWSSLFASYKYDSSDLASKILNLDFDKVSSIYEIQLLFKNKFIKLFNDNDFHLDRIFIGVTVLQGLKVTTTIFYNFKSLEDAVNCCIASSHIPFLTGGLIYKYNNEISFDGGFSNYPYLDLNNTVLKINPLIWDTTNQSSSVINYETLTEEISAEKFKEDFLKGYNDTLNNKSILDSALILNNFKLPFL